MLVLIRDVLVLFKTVFIVPTLILFVLLALMDLPIIMDPAQLHAKLPIPLMPLWDNALVQREHIKPMENASAAMPIVTLVLQLVAQAATKSFIQVELLVFHVPTIV